MWRNYNKHTAIYNTQGDIENFKFVVSLKNISSVVQVPKFDVRSSISSKPECNELVDEAVIGWQEKIFSPTEIEIYSNTESCLTDLQKKYYERVRNSNNVRQGKIFTYVYEDNFTPSEELVTHTETNKVKDYKNAICPAMEEKKMYVYAALHLDKLLLTITWRPAEKVLEVSPDFNDSLHEPYNIEIDTDYRHLYCYTIRNVSKTLSIDGSQYLQHLPGVSNQHNTILNTLNEPGKLSTRILMLFEIQTARGFEYENLHVRYKIIIPKRYSLENGELAGSTHSCTSQHFIWKFGHCFQLSIISQNEMQHDESATVCFEVISIDSWSRERYEGFGQYNVRLCAQNLADCVKCYRISNSILGDLRRYFVGGREKIDMMKYGSDTSGLLSKYGLKTQHTGILNIVCHIVLQRNKKMTETMRSDANLADAVLQKHSKARETLKNFVLEIQ